MLQSQRKLINIFKCFVEKVFIPSIKKSQTIVLTQWKKFSTMLSSNNNNTQVINYTQLQNYVDSLNSALFGGQQLTNTLASLESPEKRDFNNSNNNILSQRESSQNQLNYYKKRVTENNIDFNNQSNTNNNNNINQSIGFNPSKTFGGSRTKLMFPLKNNQTNSNGGNYNQEPQMRNTSSNLSNLSINNNLSANYNSLNSNTNDWRKINPMIFLSGMEKLSKLFADTQNKLDGQIQGAINGKGQQGYY